MRRSPKCRNLNASLLTLGREYMTHSRRGVIYTNEKGHYCNLHKDILPKFVKRRGIFQW